MSRLFNGLVPVCRKEFLHIVRDPGTLFFALLIPMLQLFLFGFAIDTNIRQIPTVVLDESRTQESRRLLERFSSSDVFALKIYARSAPPRPAQAFGFLSIMLDGFRMEPPRASSFSLTDQTPRLLVRQSAHPPESR